ncbi:hypothetical protein LPB303_16845 [Polaribacter atrinae]|uniref:Uncharacterized protein n=2 Tax=Polaribacter atrinae TaxID=1333662 RepID=A0A176SYB8_9FLAO|nr:hypothetical protein LPB303_16845 [Polaribacter atrinae]
MQLSFKERVLLFIKNIGRVLKKSLIWLIISYIIPLLNILILWAMRKNDFTVDISVVSIIIATNSCIITSLLHLFYLNEKKREFTFVGSIICILISVALYVLSLVQVELQNQFIDISIYEWGAYLTLAFSILLILISKYDEVQAISEFKAKESRNTSKTTVNGKNVKV